MCERTIFHVTLIVSLLPIALCAGVAAAQEPIYVDADAAGANNGSSWADAYGSLQDALADAGVSPKPLEIRVAAGIYRPDRGRDYTRGDRQAAFTLINGVTIRGGYAGLGEPDPDARDVTTYKSVLSGDLNSDDVEVQALRELDSHPTRRENSRHVVTGSHTDQSAVLDGFTITAGHYTPAGSPASVRGGAGMGIDSGSPTVANCLFTGNAAFSEASAMANQNGSSPTILYCTFAWNYSIHAAMKNVKSSPSLTYCTFSYNSHEGMWNTDGSSPVLSGCAFEHNEVGMSDVNDCDVTLTDCTFEGHSRNGIIHGYEGKLSLTRCVFKANGGSVGVGIDSVSDDLMLKECLFVNNAATGWGAAIECAGDRVAIEGCEFRANVSRRLAVLKAHLSGTLIVKNCTFASNSTEGSSSAINVDAGRVAISNCVFSGNRTKEEGGTIFSASEYNAISNCTFSDNAVGEGGAVVDAWYAPKVVNSVFRGNNSPAIKVKRAEAIVSYSNIEGGWPGEGNIDVDPYFVRPGYWDPNGTPENTDDDFWVDGDYHLRSQAGRWNPESNAWVQDELTSPCIDAGDPNGPIGTEPFPNGGRVNMGAYGASDQASKSYFGKPICGAILAGDINGDCVVDIGDMAILLSHWMMRGEDFVSKPPVITLVEPKDGDRIAWPGPTMFRAEASDLDGKVDKVVFRLRYQATNFSTTRGLGATEENDGWQRQYTWPGDITDGIWTVWAEATDNEGAKTLSPQITVTLYRP